MGFTTPRKRAVGMGSAHSGTAHHWSMTISSIALLILLPSFLMVIGGAIGLEREALLAYFSRPYPALVTALFLTVGMLHFIHGTRIMIDDYFRDTARKVAIVISYIFGWAVIAAALYALARMALTVAA